MVVAATPPQATVTVTASPEPVPSNSPEQGQVLSELRGWRSLYLFSVGLVIFLLALIAFRSRRGV